MKSTGGPLNYVNGHYAISDPKKSVPVIALIYKHKPKSKSELELLIEYHFKNKCSCGIISQGTIIDFGTNLYNAHLKEYGVEKFSLQECIAWEYELFITNSMKGAFMEEKALTMLSTSFPLLKITRASGFFDEDLRIDLIIYKGDKVVCGIQVKPSSYLNMRQSIINYNLSCNSKWSNVVLYLVYENDIFSNFQYIVNSINQFIVSLK